MAAASEVDTRGQWDAFHPFGQKFQRVITIPIPPDLVAGDTATYAIYDQPGGVQKAIITSSAGIALDATANTATLTISAVTMAAIPATARGSTYYHYFELLDSTGTPKFTLGGAFNYPPRERVPA